MTPQTCISGVTILVLYLTTSNTAQRFEGVDLPEDHEDRILWENIAPMVERARFPALSDQDIALLLERLRPQIPVEDQPHLEFPKLSKNQRKFGVNPGFQLDQPVPGNDVVENEQQSTNVEKKDMNSDDSVLDPFGEDLKKDTNDEAEEVFDPFNEDGMDKKASLLALTRGDTELVEAALEQERINDIYFTTIVAVSSALVAFAVVGAGICYHRYQRNAKAAEDVEYPAYGVTGNGRETSPTSADRKLAQNAQLYHYQHQKQQMIAFDANNSNGQRGNGALSDNESDDDAEEGDYTVYECPGLAPTGEMEVRNPMFDDDSSTPKADPKSKN